MGSISIKIKIFFLIFAILISFSACEKRDAKRESGIKKLVIVTSLFPLYDFAKEITKDKATVTMLLPPGLESHSFELKPADIVALNSAGVFIFTNIHMEPWVDDILKGISSHDLVIIDSSKGIKLAGQRHAHAHDNDKKHKHGNVDPHVWLDFSNALIMIDNILEGLSKKDPANAGFYEQNARNYKKRITDLDEKFSRTITSCDKRIFVSGGHLSFSYLASRYGLKYISAFEGFSPDAEPSPRQLSKIIKTMKQHGLKHIFYEELLTPRVAKTIQMETGASLLLLHAAHNISKNELAAGESFISLMEKNLANLTEGLQCQQK